MSRKLPAVKPKVAIRALEKVGWRVHRQKGSHVSMHKEGTPNLVTIPMHTKDLPKGTLHGIIEDAGLTIEEFLKLL
jgi:predicted RNA binding protein YcfA (HicA-like mRNA interferase family)